jgi:sugar lactone lactonase YvrE
MSVLTSQPTSVWSLGATLGEGPVWVARDAALWFVDIKKCHVHRYDPASGSRQSWDAPGQCGFVLPVAGGGFIAGLQQGLHRFDPATGAFTPLVAPEPHLPGNRLNDGTVDSQGRLWFGSMDDAELADTGSIYRLAADGTCVASTPKVCITNGPAHSADGSILYHIDTLGGRVHACALGTDGSVRSSEVLIAMDVAEGYPDGPVVDAEGCLWIGLFAGWGARRYSPKGELLETVRFPVANITKLAFGGADGKTLFATTAAKGLSDTDRAQQPQAGDLFQFSASVPGLPGREISVGV